MFSEVFVKLVHRRVVCRIVAAASALADRDNVREVRAWRSPYDRKP